MERPRCTRDFIPETEMPSWDATSTWGTPSNSTSVSASRYGGGSCCTNGRMQPASSRRADASSDAAFGAGNWCEPDSPDGERVEAIR